MVVIYKEKVVLQAGLMAENEEGNGEEVDPIEFMNGSVCATALRSGSKFCKSCSIFNDRFFTLLWFPDFYIANLTLFPGRFELKFLPENTQVISIMSFVKEFKLYTHFSPCFQSVIVFALGNEGVILVGSDTVRGFGPSDQTWIANISQKLESTLEDCQL